MGRMKGSTWMMSYDEAHGYMSEVRNKFAEKNEKMKTKEGLILNYQSTLISKLALAI